MSLLATMESYDTPMLDFNEDTDIAMGGLHTDSWLHPPSRMEEDSHFQDHSTGLVDENISDVVEVDMMPFEAVQEYEMADEELHGEPIHDAEVYDASIAPTPIPEPISDPVELPSDGIPPLPPPAHLPEPVGLSEPTTDQIATSEYVITTAPQDETHVHDNHPLESTPNPQIHDSTPLLQPQHHEAQRDLQVPFSVDPQHAVTGSDSDHRAADIQQRIPPLSVVMPLHSDEGVADAQSAAVQREAGHVHHEVNQDEAVPLDSEPADADKITNLALEQEPTGYDQAHAEDAPPVLLSLKVSPSNDGLLEFSLFSSPEISKRNEEDESVAHAEETLVLLQHRPGLYYDPISEVFEALRREEYFSHIEELSDSELVLNAHDIDLMISEDNVYARELSLQDLNAIHDGIGFTGPLRVMLQFTSPRFITQYNALREQLSKISIPADNSEGTHQKIEGDDVSQGGDPVEVGQEEQPEIGDEAFQHDTDDATDHAQQSLGQEGDDAHQQVVPGDDNAHHDNASEEDHDHEDVADDDDNAHQDLVQGDDHQLQSAHEGDTEDDLAQLQDGNEQYVEGQQHHEEPLEEVAEEASEGYDEEYYDGVNGNDGGHHEEQAEEQQDDLEGPLSPDLAVVDVEDDGLSDEDAVGSSVDDADFQDDETDPNTSIPPAQSLSTASVVDGVPSPRDLEHKSRSGLDPVPSADESIVQSNLSRQNEDSLGEDAESHTSYTADSSESEKTLDDDENGFDSTDKEPSHISNGPHAPLPTSSLKLVIDQSQPRPAKRVFKRRSEEAGLDGESSTSPPSSPEPKRSRT